MPIRVAGRAPGTALSQAAVAQPVGQAYGSTFDSSLTFLLGRVMHPVCNVHLPSSATGTRTYSITYLRTPGCNVIAMRLEINCIMDSTAHPATSSARHGTISVTIGGSTATPINSFHPFDGSQPIQVPNSNAGAGAGSVICANSVGAMFTERWDWFDVSAVTVGTPTTIQVTWTDDGSGATLGLESLAILEVPIADADPAAQPTTEIGIDGSWPIRRNNIFDSTASAGSGTERILDQYEKARKNPRECFQLVAAESAGAGAFASSTTTVDTALSLNVGGTWTGGAQINGYQTAYPTDAIFCLRPRTLWGTSTASRYLLRLRYQTSSAITFVFRVSVKPGTGGSFTNTDYTITSSAGVWKETTTDNVGTTMYVNIPTSDTTGTGSGVGAPLVFVKFRAWNSSPGGYFISNVALIEQET